MTAVMVCNPKGGCGKTTLATNVAGWAANRGRRVTLCDLDRQQSSLRWMSFRDESLPPIDGFFGGGQLMASLPRTADITVIDAPAGLQGYKLNDYMRLADRILIPVVPSVFDMAATEDFLNSLRNEMRGRRSQIGIVAMRVDPRTRAAAMLEEFLQHFDLPILSYIRASSNYVNAAAIGRTVFDPPRSKHKQDLVQWEPIVTWLEQAAN